MPMHTHATPANAVRPCRHEFHLAPLRFASISHLERPAPESPSLMRLITRAE